MGCCLVKDKNRDSDVELSTTTNAAVTSRSGVKGEEVKVTAASDLSSYAVSGTGIALGSCPLDCDVGMWEVKIGNPVGVALGVKRWNSKKPTPLNGSLGDDDWIFSGELHQGDVVTVFWDQTDLPMLSFHVNGVACPDASVSRIRPSVDIYPAVSVKNGASCEFVFDGQYFKYPPPSSKFKMIICATSLI